MKKMSLLCWTTANILCPQITRKALNGWSSQWWKAVMILIFSLPTESQSGGKLTTVTKKYMNLTNLTKSNRIGYFSKAFQGLWTKINSENFSRKKKESTILRNTQFSSSLMVILKLFAWQLLFYQIVAFLSCTICFSNRLRTWVMSWELRRQNWTLIWPQIKSYKLQWRFLWTCLRTRARVHMKWLRYWVWCQKGWTTRWLEK